MFQEMFYKDIREMLYFLLRINESTPTVSFVQIYNGEGYIVTSGLSRDYYASIPVTSNSKFVFEVDRLGPCEKLTLIKAGSGEDVIHILLKDEDAYIGGKGNGTIFHLVGKNPGLAIGCYLEHPEPYY